MYIYRPGVLPLGACVMGTAGVVGGTSVTETSRHKASNSTRGKKRRKHSVCKKDFDQVRQLKAVKVLMS